MKLLNSFWFVDVGRLLYNGPTISHFFINSRIKRWIDWKKWKRLMGGPLKKVSELMEWNDKPRKKTLFFFAGVSGMESTSEAPSSAHRCAASQRQLQSTHQTNWCVDGIGGGERLFFSFNKTTFLFSLCFAAKEASKTKEMKR